jgi:4-hydroxythreonine-4-phosphate dehydrogenase
VVLTMGEPVGIGPDLCVMASQMTLAVSLVVVGDPDVLQQRAEKLGIKVILDQLDAPHEATQHRSGRLQVLPLSAPCEVTCGVLDTRLAPFVLSMLDRAMEGCLQGEFDAMVTAPLHKEIINQAGIPFTGHTEYLAQKLEASMPVMMLATPGLRVALATTHLPLAEVPAAITPQRLKQVVEVLQQDLIRWFGIETPLIRVCGLNPHAGEGGYLGREELDVISPVLTALREQGIQCEGPLPADTLFTPRYMESTDAFLAMYHDQGLPVLKHMGFGRAVNITLGLPIIRTSVDHGTAVSLAGTGGADTGSLQYAIETAALCAHQRSRHLV